MPPYIALSSQPSPGSALRPRALVGALVVALLIAGCGGSDTDGTVDSDSVVSSTTTSTMAGSTPTTVAGGCADVIGVTIEAASGGFTISATVRSADTGWEKYADLWEVRSPSGSVLGERVLAHPHVDEQPFTRSLSGVAIPGDVDEVTVAARDSVAGFCGAEYVAGVPGR